MMRYLVFSLAAVGYFKRTPTGGRSEIKIRVGNTTVFVLVLHPSVKVRVQEVALAGRLSSTDEP